MATIREILKLQRKQLATLVEVRGVRRLAGVYADAQAELRERLMFEVRRGRGGSFTAFHLRTMLLQAGHAVRAFEDELGVQLDSTGRLVASLAPRQLMAGAKALEEHYQGHSPVAQLDQASLFRRVYRNVEPSLLDRFKRSKRLYGAPVVGRIRDTLAKGLIMGKGVDDVVSDVTATFGRERWRAERIVRTELSYAHNFSQHKGQQELRDSGGPTHKKLVETFDDRTGKDSKILHGQIRAVDEPFVYVPPPGQRGYPPFLMPPGRPNDRAVVIPWRLDWPESEVTEQRPEEAADASG